ncbi:MAG: response regulator [Candidatus Poribacteria bacterium]|nr:response regulator [Candidatus Poribacteria bacterium]
MQNIAHKILWIDDEIDALQPHILFLREKSYEVTPVSNGADGISLLKESHYDAVLLDQVMPGQDGMTTLDQIREIAPILPVIMVTQNSDDQLVNEALGKRISDFLMKPIGIAQIDSTLRRVLDQTKIIEGQVPLNYTQDFNQIRAAKESNPDWRKWTEIYLKLLEWDFEFDQLAQTGLEETHLEQKKECNALFSNYVQGNYTRWLRGEDSPTLSVDVVDKFVIPHLREKRPVYFIVVDCLRLDHWMAIESLLQPYFYIDRDYYFSILPSATLYSRNALFSGLFPQEIAERFPQYWQEDSEDETSTNRYERHLLQQKLQRAGIKLKPGLRYFKVFDVKGGNEFIRQVSSFDRISLSALVVNFIDILTHQRSQSDVLQQIAPDESAFRSLTKSWFAHSALFEILKIVAAQDATVVLTSDHGSVLCNRPSRAFGNRETSTSLRFKVGTSLGCDMDQAIYIDNPKQYRLPAESSSKNYIIAKEDYYFVYPNQFNEYTRQFRGGFQHGGISTGELIIPVITMTPREQS